MEEKYLWYDLEEYIKELRAVFCSLPYQKQEFLLNVVTDCLDDLRWSDKLYKED